MSAWLNEGYLTTVFSICHIHCHVVLKIKACCHDEHVNAFLSRLELIIWLIFSFKISKCPKQCTVGKKLKKSMGSRVPLSLWTVSMSLLEDIWIAAFHCCLLKWKKLFEWTNWRLSYEKGIPVYHSLGHFSFFPGLS